MPHHVHVSLPTIVLATLCVGGALRAEVELFDTREAFLARSAPNVSIEFEQPGIGDEHFPAGYQKHGLFISTSDTYLYLRHGQGPYPNSFLYGASLGDFMHIQLPPDTTAFGTNVTTFYTIQHGTVGVELSSGETRVIEVNGLWDGHGATPASSFLGVVSTEPLAWIRLEPLTNDDPRGYDSVVVDNLLVQTTYDGPPLCEVERDSCREELALCLSGPPVGDTDFDGELDATDDCPETPPGNVVDQAGCSIDEFCASFSGGSKAGRRSCELADWRNDEPLGSRDCRVTPKKQGQIPYCTRR